MSRKMYQALVVLALFAGALSGEAQNRPPVSTVNVVDPTCFTVTVSQDGNTATGSFIWVLDRSKNPSVWICASAQVGAGPGPNLASKTSVWTAATSDQQLTFFRSEVSSAIKDAVADNIINKDSANQLITTVTKDQLKEVVRGAIKDKGTWDDLVKAVAAEVKKQQSTEKAETTPPGAALPAK
jgi:hypothetical protein